MTVATDRGTGRASASSEAAVRHALLSLALLAGAPVVALAVVADPAAGSCIAPVVSHAAGPVVRGATLTVEGRRWGDDCYDTGMPPPGYGVLGRPAQDIEVLVVQGEREVVVARGDADDDLAFAVEVTVPVDLAPGSATIVARDADRSLGIVDDIPLTVASTYPPHWAERSSEPASFGTALPSAAAPADDDTSPWLRALGGAVAAVVLAALAVARRVSRRGGGR